MDRKKKIRIIEVLLLIVIIITTFTIGDTYSKYKEEIETYYRVDMKTWFLKVNEKDIYLQSDITQVIEPTFVGNADMNSNVLVPGAEFYFPMNIDYTDVNVTFKVTFSVEQLNTNKLSDLYVYKFEKPDGTTEEVNVNTISTIINPLADVTQDTGIVKVYMKWKDQGGDIMDNLADTQYRTETNTSVKLKVKATFEQYIEE